MRTKSLLKLKSALDEHWRLDQQVNLTRIGPRLFLVGGESIAPDTYVYDSGFTETEQPAATAEDKVTSPGVVRVRARPILVASLAVAGILVAGASFAFVRPTDWLVGTRVNGQEPTSGQGAARGQTGASQLGAGVATPRKSAAALPCRLDTNTLQPLTVASRPESGGTLRLVEDIVLGGERQQEIEFSCGNARSFYQLRFSLVQGSWKAKSATPMGSHS